MTDAIRFSTLTERQRECLRLYWTCRSYDAVAYEIGKSSETVKDHLRKARQHLGAASSMEAAHLFAVHEARATPHQRVPPTGVAAEPQFDGADGLGPDRLPVDTWPAIEDPRLRMNDAGAGHPPPPWGQRSDLDVYSLKDRLPPTLANVLLAGAMVALIIFAAWAATLVVAQFSPAFFRTINHIHS